jgi:hypothetical protein
MHYAGGAGRWGHIVDGGVTGSLSASYSIENIDGWILVLIIMISMVQVGGNKKNRTSIGHLSVHGE